MTNTTESLARLLGQTEAYLRENHLARAMAYFGLAGITLQTFAHFAPRNQHFRLERVHLAVLPITLAVTRGFVQLRPEDRAQWQRGSMADTLKKAAIGAGLGAASLLSTLAIARAKGWLSAPAWGQPTADGLTPALSATMFAVSNLAIALNEELVFRGYGYTTLALALREPLPSSIVTALFALAHPLNPRTLAGEAALGLALLALRRRSGDIWMSVGFHWASNVLQSAVFGPADGPPSIRPLQLHGPEVWVGRPGHPDPGLLATLVCLAVALGVTLWPAADHTIEA